MPAMGRLQGVFEMKRRTDWKAASVASVMLAMGGALTEVAHADYIERVEGNTVVMRYTLKGSLGHTYRVSRENAADIVAVPNDRRQEAVAGFRVETDAQGRQWVYKHPTLKGAVGAGWVRTRLSAGK
jgi:hypothetical protein